jgi:outer membrane protein assembly factor BamB
LPDPQGFSGGPAVDANGHIYVASNSATLYSITADGSVRWQRELPVEPVGSPALGPQASAAEPAGRSVVYVTDQAGGLMAFDTDGRSLWRFQTQTKRRASSSPVVGPSGTIYYTVVDRVEAVSPAGTSVWTSARLPGSGEAAPRLDIGETFLFVQDAALDIETGQLLDFGTLVVPGTAGINAIYMVGPDGFTYLREAHGVIQWEMTDAGPQRIASASWESRTATIYLPQESAVGPSGSVWFVYGSNYDDLRLVTLSMEGRLLGNIFYAQRGSKLIAIDAADRAIVCGQARSGHLECTVFAPGAEKPVWQVTLPDMAQVNGGALVPGRLYVTTRDGALYAISDGAISDGAIGDG